MTNAISSNLSGLRFAEQTDVSTLPVTPTWFSIDANEHNDIGAEVTTTSRSPINPGRKERKGTVTDLDATAGFTSDFTQTNMFRLLRGVFMCTGNFKLTTTALDSAAVPITSVDSALVKYVVAASMPAFKAGNILLASKFTNSGNNGKKIVSTNATATEVVVTGALTTETPTADAKLELVGHRFGSGVASIVISGTEVRLSFSAAPTGFTLKVGEWIYVGGDLTAEQFATGKGWARIGQVTANYWVLDNATWTPVADTGTSKTIEVYMGNALYDEPLVADVVRKYYQIERSLGFNVTQAANNVEYVIGCTPNEFTLNVPTSEKLTTSLTFVGTTHSTQYGEKSGNRPTAINEEAFNTSSNVPLMKLATITAGVVNATPLLACFTDFSVTVNNGANATKCIGTLGANDVLLSNFVVTASASAYFADITAIQAVRNNTDLDFVMAVTNKNAGWLMNMPLLSISGGMAEVAKDEAIMLPIEIAAFEGKNGHTLVMQQYPYLPTVAMS